MSGGLEGLWVVKFTDPNNPGRSINGGVVVVETQRILGGDSGYYYTGEVSQGQTQGTWKCKLTVVRHDKTVSSIFGDIDNINLQGLLTRKKINNSNDPLIHADLHGQGHSVLAILKRVAKLP